MGVNDAVWGYMQKQLGYSDEEMAEFKADPRNKQVLEKGLEMAGKTFVAEVVDSHGCASGHRVGDKIYFDGAGNLLAKHAPKRCCIYALNALSTTMFAATELYQAGVDPNQMMFKRCGCFDVGLKCGGWGHIVMELSLQDGHAGG